MMNHGMMFIEYIEFQYISNRKEVISMYQEEKNQKKFISCGIVIRADPDKIKTLIKEIQSNSNLFLVFYRMSEHRLRIFEES